MKATIQRIAVIGSTGSIGQQTLEIINHFPDKFKVVGLAGGENIDLLNRQINQFQPDFVYYRKKINLPPRVRMISLDELAILPEVDIVVIATAGIVGLSPTLAAIRSGKRIALANKEVLVIAGKIITTEAKRHGAKLLPIDSEHSAIWQCLRGERSNIAKLILTASGGPFYHYSKRQLSHVLVENALKHPTWKMGKKVTIDSATLINKGLEVIEAHWLFSVPYNKIDIVIHPGSIIHSLVEFSDGSLKAQLSYPDMRLPIQFALSYPQRLPNNTLPRLDFDQISSLIFEPVNYERFPCLKLALDAGEKGGTCPAALCAADEIAVELFLKKRIAFTSIASLIKETLNLHKNITHPTLGDIIETDIWARETALRNSQKRSLCY